MEKNYNFNQLRSIGDLINDSFRAFISSQHLWKTIAISTLPVIIIYAYFGVQLQIDLSQITGAIKSLEDFMRIFQYILKNPTAIVALTLSFLSTFWLTLISYIYIWLYNTRENFEVKDVLQIAAKKIITAFLSEILLFILLFSGFVLFVIPGIYLVVPLQFYIIVRIFEDETLLDGVNRSLQLNKDFWLVNFGLLILSYILVSFADTIINFPMNFLDINSPVGIVYSYFSISAQSLLQFYIPFIFALQYYNIRFAKGEITDKNLKINQ